MRGNQTVTRLRRVAAGFLLLGFDHGRQTARPIGNIEFDCVHADGASGKNVFGAVIDIEALLVIESIRQIAEDLGSGLCHAEQARNDDCVKVTHERICSVQKCDLLGRVIAQRMDAIAEIMAPIELLNSRGDGASEHLFPIRHVRAYPPRIARKIFDELLGRGVEAESRIEIRMPLRRADAGQKRFDLVDIVAQMRDEKMARVPVDEHAAEIEHDVPNARHVGVSRPVRGESGSSIACRLTQRGNPFFDRRMRHKQPLDAGRRPRRDAESLHRLRQ
jgi:hypothetical protein